MINELDKEKEIMRVINSLEHYAHNNDDCNDITLCQLGCVDELGIPHHQLSLDTSIAWTVTELFYDFQNKEITKKEMLIVIRLMHNAVYYHKDDYKQLEKLLFELSNLILIYKQ